MATKRTLPGDDVAGVTVSEDISDSTNKPITPKPSADDDLAYIAKKLGLDVNQLRQERLAKEKQEKLKTARAKQDRKQKNKELHEKALIESFFRRQNKSVFIFIDGKPVTVKDFEDVKCPSCSQHIGMAVKGRVLDLMDTQPYITINPLAPVHGILAIYDRIYCDAPTPDKRHTCILRIQQIDPLCEP